MITLNRAQRACKVFDKAEDCLCTQTHDKILFNDCYMFWWSCHRNEVRKEDFLKCPPVHKVEAVEGSVCVSGLPPIVCPLVTGFLGCKWLLQPELPPHKGFLAPHQSKMVLLPPQKLFWWWFEASVIIRQNETMMQLWKLTNPRKN